METVLQCLWTQCGRCICGPDAPVISS